MIINFARRAHNHNWELDPVIRSLLDTDFYKLLMLQFIWKHYPATHVSFSLFNRSTSVRLADMFSREELIHQMEHARSLRSGSRATLSMADAESSNLPFWNGWNAISDCPTMSSRSRTDSSSFLSTACGPIPQCGNSTRFPSSTSSRPEPV